MTHNWLGLVRWLNRQKSLTTKPENLNSIPRTYMVQAENYSHKLSSGLHVCVVRDTGISHH